MLDDLRPAVSDYIGGGVKAAASPNLSVTQAQLSMGIQYGLSEGLAWPGPTPSDRNSTLGRVHSKKREDSCTFKRANYLIEIPLMTKRVFTLR
jgi:hypothetical protein